MAVKGYREGQRSARATAPGRRRALGAGLAIVLISVAFSALLASRTVAQQANATIRVAIERIEPFGLRENPSRIAYAEISIGAQTFTTPQVQASSSSPISPEWDASSSVPVDQGRIPIRVAVFTFQQSTFTPDNCSPLNLFSGCLEDVPPDCDPTDILSISECTGPFQRHLDINAAFSEKDQFGTVGLNPCDLEMARVDTAEQPCGTTLSDQGTDFPGAAVIDFRVDVTPPPTAPGLNVRCTHSPTWPQPGDNVTITAESLDDAVAPKTGNIDIWVNDKSDPAGIQSGVSTMTHNAGSFTADSFSYGCRVSAGDEVVFSGWRTVRVGGESTELAVPVLYNGNRGNRVDVVFLPDVDSYAAGASDATFLDDVMDVIKNGYWSKEVFLAYQDRLNFWVARDTADAESFPTCHTGPANRTQYDFGDTLLILHTDNLRDCSAGGLISSEPTSYGTVLHESGHDPFGLADEYCCDSNYFAPDPNPNLYTTQTACEDDAPVLGRTAADCRSFQAVKPGQSPTATWYLSDPSGDDMMESSGTRTPQAADIRRIQWMFAQCDRGGC